MNLREVLQDTYNRRGALTPAGLVDDARGDAHPLHTRFEWDNAVAGDRYREVQAAQIIRSVKITYSETPEGEKSVRAFLSVKRDPDDDLGAQSSYEPTEKVLTSDFQRELVLREFEREWRTFRARYSHLAEFAALIRREVA